MASPSLRRTCRCRGGRRADRRRTPSSRTPADRCRRAATARPRVSGVAGTMTVRAGRHRRPADRRAPPPATPAPPTRRSPKIWRFAPHRHNIRRHSVTQSSPRSCDSLGRDTRPVAMPGPADVEVIAEITPPATACFPPPAFGVCHQSGSAVLSGARDALKAPPASARPRRRTQVVEGPAELATPPSSPFAPGSSHRRRF